MDLSNLDSVAAADEGAELQLKHPVTGQVLVNGADNQPISIWLAGTDSERYRKVEKIKLNKQFQQGRGGRRTRAYTAEEMDDDAVDILAACTMRWQNIELDGKPLEFSAASAAALYRRLPWVREQVDVFMADRANFLKA